MAAGWASDAFVLNINVDTELCYLLALLTIDGTTIRNLIIKFY